MSNCEHETELLPEECDLFAGECDMPETECDSLMEEYFAPTMFGEAEVFTLETDDGVPVRVLYVAGGFQSATYLGERRFEPVFEYYRAIDRAFDAGRCVRRVLMIGGGGFSYPKHLLTSGNELLRDVRIDVVEIDPAIVDIARSHFFLDEVEKDHGSAGTGRLGVIVADGREFLRSAEPAAYDIVVNDSFDGIDPSSELLSAESLVAAKHAMAKGGLYLINTVAETPEEAEPLARVIHSAFANTYLLLCPDEEFDGSSNSLLIASDEAVDLPDLITL
ncbi:MAG: fused MFS/spermidine synthase [Eggerthellaceae bacterium]|nr:fused MFS/spermidine synthase [Eggerthellaceae bacterium]